MRNRLLIVVAIICGSLAAGLFWKSFRQPARPIITDAYAKARGFRSAAQFMEFDKKGPNLFRHAKAWDADDFAYFRQAIATGSEKPGQFAVLALGQLVSVDQCRQGLAIVGRLPAKSADQRAVWLDTLTKWNTNPTKRPLVAEVMQGNNADLAEFGREVANADKTPR